MRGGLLSFHFHLKLNDVQTLNLILPPSLEAIWHTFTCIMTILSLSSILFHSLHVNKPFPSSVCLPFTLDFSTMYLYQLLCIHRLSIFTHVHLHSCLICIPQRSPLLLYTPRLTCLSVCLSVCRWSFLTVSAAPLPPALALDLASLSPELPKSLYPRD